MFKCWFAAYQVNNVGRWFNPPSLFHYLQNGYNMESTGWWWEIIKYPMTEDCQRVHSTDMCSLAISPAVLKSSLIPYLIRWSSLNHLPVTWLFRSDFNSLIFSSLTHEVEIQVVPTLRHSNQPIKYLNFMWSLSLGFLKISFLPVFKVHLLLLALISHSSLILVSQLSTGQHCSGRQLKSPPRGTNVPLHHSIL